MTPTRRPSRFLVATLASTVAVAFSPSPAARASDASGDVYAIVVGYNGARAGLPTLRFADDDAVRFALLFGALAGGQSEQVRLLAVPDADTLRGLARAGLTAAPTAAPTRSALAAAFAEIGRLLATRPPAAPPPTFYFVYAGHGLRGRILLQPEGGEGPGRDAGYTGRELRTAVAELAAHAPTLRSYVFLDACRSQSLFTERGGADDAGPDLSAEVSALEERAEATSIGVLTAAFSAHAAGEVGALASGYFSHVLASGLAGAADANADRLVSFAELAAFVAFNTERLGAQRPWFSPPGGDLAASTVDLRGARTILDLSAAPMGRYLVEAQGGRPILAEAVKGVHPLRLVLPAGKYRVRRTNADQLESAAEIDLVTGVPLDLARATWSVVASGPVARGGSQADAVSGDSSAGEGDTTSFVSAFTPEVVATLTAAFLAAREPASTSTRRHNRLALAATAADAPLGLSGLQLGVELRYRRILGDDEAHRGAQLFVGSAVSFGRSSHQAGQDYRLDRWLALVETGPRWVVLDGLLAASLAGALGGGPLLRRGADGAWSGDVFSPFLGLGGGLEVRVERTWFVFAEGRLALQWANLDTGRQRTSHAAVRAGISWAF